MSIELDHVHVDEAGTTTERVLVIEDHQLLAQLIVHQLRNEGLDAELAPVVSREDVLAAARAQAYDAVLLDLDLGPEVGDGIELIGALRETGARVVMLTAITDRHRHAECVEAGAAGVVTKDRRFDELLETLRAAITCGSVLRPGERDELLAQLRRKRQERERRLAPFERLTHREQEVLAALMSGSTAREVAADWVVSYETVRTQIRSVLAKLGAHSQIEAVAMARQAGWRLAEPRHALPASQLTSC